MTATGSAKHSRRYSHTLALILAAHLALGTWYSVVTPSWEAFDEWGHYLYVRRVIEERRLPSVVSPASGSEVEMRIQPPLFYVLAAVATCWVRMDSEAEPVVNAWWSYGGNTQTGVNMMVHSSGRPTPCPDCTSSSLIAIRLLSALLGTVAVWLAYCLGSLLFPDRPALALSATAVTAFTPTFVFLGSVVNNDIGAAVFGVAAVYYLARWLVLRGWWGDAALFLLCYGLAALTKATAYALLPTALAVALAALAYARRREERGKWCTKLAALYVAIAAAAMLTAIVIRLFQATAESPNHSIERLVTTLFLNTGSFVAGMHWAALPKYASYLAWTYWASFGWGNLKAPTWAYLLAGLWSVSAFLGCLRCLRSPRTDSLQRMRVAFLILVIAIPAALAILFSLYVGWAPHARYLLFVTPAVSLLLCLGVTQWVTGKAGDRVLAALAVGMFFFAAAVPPLVIAPAYAPPKMLAESQAVSVPHVLGDRFEDKAELVGYDLQATGRGARARVCVTLYWRALAPMEENYSMELKILSESGNVLGQLYSYPGQGNYATSLWKPGDFFKDEYCVSIASQGVNLGDLKAQVRLFLYPTGHTLQVSDPEGKPIGEVALLHALLAKAE